MGNKSTSLVEKKNRARVPKKTSVSKEKSRNTAIVGELPPPIDDVCFQVDENGQRNGCIVVRVQKSTSVFIVNQHDCVKGNYGDIAALVVELRLREYNSPKGLRDLFQVIANAATGEVYVANRDGFHRWTIGSQQLECYVWRSKAHSFAGKQGDLPVVVRSQSPVVPPASCTLKLWKQKVGVHVVANPYLLVGGIAALSAPLIRPFRLSRAVLAYIGASGAGKNSCQQAAESFIRPSSQIESFSGTEKGIASSLREQADMAAFLEEPRQSENHEGIVRVIFDLASGGTRKVSTAHQKASATEPLSCTLILSNELTLAEMLAGKRVVLNEGIGARYFEIHADAPFGMFHTLPKGMNAAAFADSLKDASARYHGAVWDAWVSLICRDATKLRTWIPITLDRLHKILVKDVPPEDRVTRRLLRTLSAWGCAGIYAANNHILPTTPKAIVAALKLAVRQHLARQAHHSTPVGERVIAAVRDIIDRNSSRFPAFESITSVTQPDGLYGYRAHVDKEKLYLFLPSVFEELIGKQFGTQAALRQLKQADFLSTDSEGFQRQFRIATLWDDTTRKRFYAIREAIRFERK